MKNNLPENTPDPSASPVGGNGAALASQFPGALPTAAPGILNCPTRLALTRHLSAGLQGLNAAALWNRFANLIDTDQPEPLLN